MRKRVKKLDSFGQDPTLSTTENALQPDTLMVAVAGGPGISEGPEENDTAARGGLSASPSNITQQIERLYSVGGG